VGAARAFAFARTTNALWVIPRLYNSRFCLPGFEPVPADALAAANMIIKKIDIQTAPLL
jgi:hypothetical protein